MNEVAQLLFPQGRLYDVSQWRENGVEKVNQYFVGTITITSRSRQYFFFKKSCLLLKGIVFPRTTDVMNYFKGEYGITLNYPNGPCLR